MTLPAYLYKYLLILTLLACYSAKGVSQDLHVTFVISSPDPGPYENVYITGNIEQLGNWDPARVKMESKEGNQWVIMVSIDQAQAIEYKFTLGSWEREGANEEGGTLPNYKVTISTDTVIHNTINAWKSPSPPAEAIQSLAGTICTHKKFKSIDLPDRDIIVWLPDGYQEDPSSRYPVVYMHDGQNIFDASTSAFGTEWNVDESIDSMIRIKALPPIIAVGIYNSPLRSLEYTPGDTGTRYMNFVVNTLKPFIDSTYRTRSEPWNTCTGGASAGGLIAFMLAWEFPSIFSKAICMSPAFKISTIDYVKTVEATEELGKKPYFYIYNGGVGLEADLRPGNDDMITALINKGYQLGKDYDYIIHENGKHEEGAWAGQFPDAIKKCFPNL